MKICLVCADGGHLTEILQLMDAFEGHETFFVTYRSTRSESLKNKYLFENTGKNHLKILFSILPILKILRKEKPDLIVSTGGEIAIPVFYIAKLLGIKTIFLDSWSRVDEPTMTGKIVYQVADVFLVQWKQLLRKYGKKAEYWGAVF